VEFSLTEWPVLTRLLWTVATIGGAYLLGFLVNRVVFRRLAMLARRTGAEWDTPVIAELRRRIPLWSLLVGVWLSLGYWPIPGRWVSFSSNLLKALGIASVTFAVAAIATKTVAAVGPRAQHGVRVSGLAINVVRMVVFAVGLLILLNALGVNVTPALAALGVGGLAVALALQEPLSNLFAGVFVAVSRQVKIGDYIRLDSGAEGYVSDLKWHSTQIESLGGNLLVVPNSKLAQSIVTNYSAPTRDVAVAVDITVDYASDLALVERVTMDEARGVMKEVMGALPDFEPAVRFTAFNEFGVRFNVGLRARDFPDVALVRHELLKRLETRYQHEGIVLFRYKAPPPNVKTVADR
jgi:small-conductance mechanosensitive channel